VAVVSERGQQSVYVASGDTAQQRTVEVGFQDDESAEIVGGLDDGEMVVVQGQRALRDGQPIRILDRMDLDSEVTSGTSGDGTDPGQGG
jgi:multidrug efflux pump subunit AcrA (membrane-fusion protein)